MKRKRPTNRSLVFYSENCVPHVAKFKTYTAAEKFVAKFHKDNRHNRTDNWVDCIIRGNLIRTYEGWSSFVLWEDKK